MNRLRSLLVVSFLFVRLSHLDGGAAEPSGVVVDEHGVMRWTASGEEVALFGVNYTAPFAHAFRAHARLGVALDQAIAADVYHFARLGFDAYRIHVWDREISDAEGNLLDNAHVRAFDLLLASLKARGISSILTPLQFGNAGYPEPGVPLPGFSTAYGKQGCLEDRTSWPMQERYLRQFVSHVNPHTGLAYKDDPGVIAFEICNEPGHFEYELTLDYINRMTRAIRATGCTKPVFYNMSHGLGVASAYLDAEVQGGTFQWYPANLVADHEQRGNFLPYVDEYPIPFAGDARFGRKAKIVYEFDAADIGRGYIYPAIARTFRKAGMQVAAQFAYDPMYIAASNTEYQTHYLNLAYAPQKALGMKIAGEAFRRVPREKDFGAYPGNTRFADVRVSYLDDLAELATPEKFFYSNTTTTVPTAPDKLEHVAGCGDSPVVAYPGNGAYFLDRLAPGVWRLEVMPDAIWVHDPFGKPSPRKQVSRIAWNTWTMRIALPDLGAAFSATGLDDGNTFAAATTDGRIAIRPGSYLLTRAGASAAPWSRESRLGNIQLKEFAAPAASLDKTYVLHQPVPEASAGRTLRVTALVAAPAEVGKVELVVQSPRPAERPVPRPAVPPRRQPGGGNTPGTGPAGADGVVVYPMTRRSGLDFAAEIPGGSLVPGALVYHVVVTTADGVATFPAGSPGSPTDWDFVGDGWTVRIVPASAPVLLFDAATDAASLTGNDRETRYPIVPSDRPGTSALAMGVSDLLESEHDHSVRSFFPDRIRGREPDVRGRESVVVYARSATTEPCPLQVALVSQEGISYGAVVDIPAQWGPVVVPVSALRQVRGPNIPHGYPEFIPFWSSVESAVPLELTRAESVQLSIGPGISAEARGVERRVEIERIWLE